MSSHEKNALKTTDIPPYAENRILVKFKEPQAIDEKNQFSNPPVTNTMFGIGIEKIEPINPAPSQLLADTVSLGSRSNQNKWAAVTLTDSGPEAVSLALDRFGKSGEYEYVEKDSVIRPGSADSGVVSCMCGGGCLYGLRKIGAPQAWEITKGHRSIVVGIIDSGIDISHPSLNKNIWVNPNIGASGYADDKYGFDFVDMIGIDDTYLQNDHSGHGTHVAGTVGAAHKEYTSVVGVAWNVQLAAIRIIGDTGYDYVSTAAKGINYANNMGFPITNNSYGMREDSMLMRDVIREAGLFVTASMNEGWNVDEEKVYPGCYDFDNLINVAATDYNDELADFSNYGAKTVHLAAPGVDICSAHAKMGYIRTHGFYTMGGTSMASPHVAGAATLVLSILRGQEAAKLGGRNAEDRGWITELRDRLLKNTDAIECLQGKTITGGRLNVFRAVAPDQK